VLRYGLWIMAEIAIIGSDIQEVIGSAIALLLLSHGAIPLWAGVLLSVALGFSMLLVERYGIRKLEGLFGVLIAIMVGSFAVRAVALRVCGWEWGPLQVAPL
jgi:natural resistance-associated macrophage protein